MIASKEAILCLNCGHAVKGRSDKKFCNDNCRNEYNNGLKQNSSNTVRNINNALGKNRRTLESLLQDGKDVTKVHVEKLLEKGFQFKYHTHTFTNKKGEMYFFCYDMGYLTLSDDWFLIVKRREE